MLQNTVSETGKIYSYEKDHYTKAHRKDNRKVAPDMRKNWQASEMHELYHEIARQLVLGQKPKDIAEHLDITYQTVINVKNSPVVQEQINILQGAVNAETVDVAKKIREMAPKCLKILEEIMEDPEAGTAIRSKNALALLDRAGHSPIKNVNVTGSHVVVSGDQLERIKQRAIEIGLNSGVVADAEYEEAN